MSRIRIFLLPVTISVTLAAALTLSGCARTLVGAGATAGTAAMEERGISGVADDTAIRLRLNALYSDDDERLWRKIGFQVYGGGSC